MKRKIHLTLKQRIKKNLWRHIYPVFPWLQNHLLKWHLIWHEKGRQPYHIGWLAPDKTLEQLEKHLYTKWGFGNHFVAWKDNGQVLSWRKLTNFDYQYHLRVFKDGELRGHYEYTPESKPVDHFIEIGEEPKMDDFYKFLDGYIVKHKYISHLRPDVNIAPDSEITVDDISKTNAKHR